MLLRTASLLLLSSSLLLLQGCGTTFEGPEVPRGGGAGGLGGAAGSGNSSGGNNSAGGSSDELVSCAPSEITCETLVPPAACPEGEVHSAVNDCYGPCVPIEQCKCSHSDDCPNSNVYVCWNSAQHCGPYVN